MEGLLGLLLGASRPAGCVGCELVAVEAVVVRSNGEGLLELLMSSALHNSKAVQSAHMCKLEPAVYGGRKHLTLGGTCE